MLLIVLCEKIVERVWKTIQQFCCNAGLKTNVLEMSADAKKNTSSVKSTR